MVAVQPTPGGTAINMSSTGGLRQRTKQALVASDLSRWVDRLLKSAQVPPMIDPPGAFYWPVGLGFAILCFAVNYPGRLTSDSLYSIITMASHRDIGNWHSATLGWLWSLPGPLLGQPAGALLMQSAFFGLFAGFLPRTLATFRGWLTLLLELVLRLSLVGAVGMIGKDVITLIAMLIGVSLLRSVANARFTYLRGVALIALLTLFLLVKAPNFLVIVLAVAMILPFLGPSFKTYAGFVAITLGLGVLAIPLNRTIDGAIFHAQDVHPDKQLVIFDLAAISIGTGSNAFAKAQNWPTRQLPSVKSCFLPYMWDSFAPWAPCAGYSSAYDGLDSALKRAWVTAILTHPIVYARHRLTYAGYLVQSRDYASWGIGGAAVNDASSRAGKAEMDALMAKFKADHPVQLWRATSTATPFRVLETALWRFPKIQSVALIGSLALLLFAWLGRRDGIRLAVLIPACLGLGNFGMLLVFGVADPARYLLPTVGLFYVALLALLAPATPAPFSGLRASPSDD